MGKKRALRLLVNSFLYCSGYNLFTELYNDLKFPDGTQLYLDKQNGKYGYNTDPNRGADTFHPFSNGFNGVKMYYLKKITDSSGAYLNINENTASGFYNYGADYDPNTRKTTIKYAGKYSIMISVPSGSYTAFYLNNSQIEFVGSSSKYFTYDLKEGDVLYFTGSQAGASAYIEKISD